jgi:hypothetical protein
VTVPDGSTRIVAASDPAGTGIPGAAGVADPIPVSSAYEPKPMPTSRPAARIRSCFARAAV